MGDSLKASLLGAASAINAFISLEYLLDCVNRKSAIFQNQLNNRELTEQAYKIAMNNAETMTNFEYVPGVISAMIAGFLGTTAIYYACRGNKEQIKNS